MAREVWINLSRFERAYVMKWDHYEYKIAEHFLSALINCDETGLEDGEQTQFEQWEEQARADAHNTDRDLHRLSCIR